MVPSRLVRSFLAAVGLFLILVGSGPGASANAAPGTFEWNVMLSQWQVLGPIAKLTCGGDELDRTLVPDEADLCPGEPVTIAGKEFAWHAFRSPGVNFLRALPIEDQAGQCALAYAWTDFTSDDSQDAILAIGHDDGAVVWLNGREVYRSTKSGASALDQATIRVSLNKGRNTLLAKVSQNYGEWNFMARLRPPGLDKPLISATSKHSGAGDQGRLPTLQVELLDGAGNVIQTLHTSGGRGAPLRYVLYAAEPDPPPAKVRLRYDGPGFVPFDQTCDWSEARSGNLVLPLELAGPIEGRIVDRATGKPVARAELRLSSGDSLFRTDADGRFSFELKNPLTDLMDIGAAGYEPLSIPIAWPPSKDWSIELQPGGHVLRGQVLTQDGQPIAGAVVQIDVRGREKRLTTDAEGRFEEIGIPGRTKMLWPTVTHPDFVGEDSFTQPLDDGVTEVQWRLEAAATVTGLVTAKEDGRPLAGITIQAGADRFGSTVNPETQTDDDGRYRLTGVKAGLALVHAFSDGFAPAMQAVTTSLDEAAAADFELEPGQPVTGRVTDPDGNPVASVWLPTDTWNGARMFCREVRTAADGTFRFEHMPPTPVQTDVMKQGYISQRRVPFVGGEHYDITLVPVVEHTVHVRLGDTDKPPRKLTVQKGYHWPGRTAVSWQDVGSYDNEAKYDASTGTVRISLDEPNGNAKISWRFRVPGYRDGVFENPEAGAKAQSVEMVLEPAATITGRVVSAESGQPLEGVLVALVSRQERLRSDFYVNYDSGFRAAERFTGVHVRTAADGSFELPALDKDADADLLLFRKGAGFHFIRDARTVLATTPIELPLPDPGEVTGRVVVAGEPVADQPVHISWMAPGDNPDPWDLPFGFGGQVKANGDGRFRFTGLGPGRYRLGRVRSFDNPVGGGVSTYLTSEEIIVLPGQTVTHDLVQPAGHKLTGQTLDADGKPLGNCLVSAYQDGDSRECGDAAMTDADGRFTISNLQPGVYRLSAQHYEPTRAGCGIGAMGATGSTTVKVDGDTETTIKVSPRAGARIAAAGAAGQSTLVGSVPPDFTGKPINRDQPFTLSDHFGKVVAIDFWATWCGPCMAVMPELKKLYEKYKDSDDVVFITVSLDQDADSLKGVMEQQGLEFPVVYESRDQSEAIAQAFGVRGIPSSFVVGRDGRFAADSMHGSQLASAVEAAVAKPLDPAFAEGVKPARLMVKLALDRDESGVPGATIKLTAVDAAGATVREETIDPPGQARQFTWLYPPLADGGQVRVAVTAVGLDGQEKTVPSPGEKAEAAFAFASPRTLSGSVAVDDAAPAPDMKITAYRDDGFRRVATTDAEGRFQLPVMPGSYWLSITGTGDFAPIAGEREQVAVGVDIDPAPVRLAACRTVTLTGTVTDEDGQSVADAEVHASGSSKKVVTDESGRFELGGVPSRGVVQLYAFKQPKFAMATLQDCDGSEPLTLVLGQQPGRGGLGVGTKVPALVLCTLEDGQSREWQPAAGGDSLVVFCALWHPAGRELVERANAWADQHGATLTVASIDWSLAAARRAAAALDERQPGQYEVLFAGPGGLEIAKAWNIAPPAQAYLVSPSGKVRKAPQPGALP